MDGEVDVAQHVVAIAPVRIVDGRLDCVVSFLTLVRIEDLSRDFEINLGLSKQRSGVSSSLGFDKLRDGRTGARLGLQLEHGTHGEKADHGHTGSDVSSFHGGFMVGVRHCQVRSWLTRRVYRMGDFFARRAKKLSTSKNLSQLLPGLETE